MRPSLSLSILSFLLIADHAAAGPLGGGGGGGGGGRGPLGRTSGGIGAATGSSSSSSSSGGTHATSDDPDYREGERCHDRHGREALCRTTATGIVIVEPLESEPARPYTGDRAKLDFYAGAQKVVDSEGSLTLEAAISDGYRFRMIGTLHHYFESQPDMSRITMTMPTLMAGVRIDDLGATAVHVDGGVVHASTKGDVMGNSSITGPIIGLSVEHRLTRKTSLLGDVRTMWFEDDVRANGGRVGIRHGYLQAALRVLDFNVGPALWGPEVGVRF